MLPNLNKRRWYKLWAVACVQAGTLCGDLGKSPIKNSVVILYRTHQMRGQTTIPGRWVQYDPFMMAKSSRVERDVWGMSICLSE